MQQRRAAASRSRRAGQRGARGAAQRGLRGTWSCVASVGDDPCLRPEDGDTEVPVGDDLALVLRGRPLAAEDQRVLAAFATQVAVAYQQRQLAEAAPRPAPLAESDRIRTALLNAVSHDLRTPIASAKAAVSSLRSQRRRRGPSRTARNCSPAPTTRSTGSPTWSPTCSTCPGCRPACCRSQPRRSAWTTSSAARSTTQPDRRRRSTSTCRPKLPEVLADAGLLERVIANLVENALRYSPPGEPVRVTASAHGGTVELRVIDRGPGIRPADREAVFAPFQRRDDHATSTGAGRRARPGDRPRLRRGHARQRHAGRHRRAAASSRPSNSLTAQPQ